MRTMRLITLLVALHATLAALAQPDSLYVTENGTTTAYAVVSTPNRRRASRASAAMPWTPRGWR